MTKVRQVSCIYILTECIQVFVPILVFTKTVTTFEEKVSHHFVSSILWQNVNIVFYLCLTNVRQVSRIPLIIECIQVSLAIVRNVLYLGLTNVRQVKCIPLFTECIHVIIL